MIPSARPALPSRETAVKAPSPLLGFNNNVRHRGRVFHIQTEDSGIRHPHILTRLYADGGRILKTTKTSYAEHIGQERIAETVRGMMQEQHKAMFIALRDGQFDYLFDENAAPGSTRVASRGAAPAVHDGGPLKRVPRARPAPRQGPRSKLRNLGPPSWEAPPPEPVKPVAAEAPPPEPAKPAAPPPQVAPPLEPPVRPPPVAVPAVAVPQTPRRRPPSPRPSRSRLRRAPDDAPPPPRPTAPKPAPPRPIVVPRPQAASGAGSAVPAHYAPTQPAQPAVAAAP